MIRGHAEIAQQGGSAWNIWRRQNPDIRPVLYRAGLFGRNLNHARLNSTDLRSANLSDASVRDANLTEAKVLRADCHGADFTKSRLIGADFSYANLAKATLCNANCTKTNFLRSNLSGANLRDADLSNAILVGANLTGADLTDATIEGAFLGSTLFADVDLTSLRGLESVHHRAPSTVGIDTIIKSKGKIPDAFLRGAGVPDVFLTYMGSLIGRAIEFYSCFISYSSADQEFAERLHADIQAKGVRCWFAPEDLKIGDRFQERIEESIRVFDKVMIVLSDASVRSRWVEREVNAAWEREEREKRTVLFPIRIDDAVMQAPNPWAADIRRSRQIGDFRCWKDHDVYKKAVERLLRDLKGSEDARR